MRVLITGVTGQDGSYLAGQLLTAGHDVYGLVRGHSTHRRDWLLDLLPQVQVLSGDLLDQMSLVRALDESCPDVVYNLAAVSSPALGWRQPTHTADVTGLGLLRLLEAVVHVVPTARVVQASSIALHGPYGAAKAFADAVADDYRARGTHVSSAVMGGHHSPRRGREFFARRVTRAVAEIYVGRREMLPLGPLGRRQDWGFAYDFTTALQEVADLDPDRYVVSTGHPHSCQEWVEAAFEFAGLDHSRHVVHDPARAQPTDIEVLSAQPDPRLDWEPRVDMRGLAAEMVQADVAELRA